MVEITSNENVTNISGVPTWMIVLIEKMIERNKVKNLLEVWPNLEVFFHGAVSFTPYEELFKSFTNIDYHYRNYLYPQHFCFWGWRLFFGKYSGNHCYLLHIFLWPHSGKFVLL